MLYIVQSFSFINNKYFYFIYYVYIYIFVNFGQVFSQYNGVNEIESVGVRKILSYFSCIIF